MAAAASGNVKTEDVSSGSRLTGNRALADAALGRRHGHHLGHISNGCTIRQAACQPRRCARLWEALLPLSAIAHRVLARCSRVNRSQVKHTSGLSCCHFARLWKLDRSIWNRKLLWPAGCIRSDNEAIILCRCSCSGSCTRTRLSTGPVLILQQAVVLKVRVLADELGKEGGALAAECRNLRR